MSGHSFGGINVEDMLARAHVVSLPLRVRFRGVREREALLFEGPKGWGEFSPFLEYGVPESAEWLRCGLEMAFAGPTTVAGQDCGECYGAGCGAMAGG